jgi:hypothetical protein
VQSEVSALVEEENADRKFANDSREQAKLLRKEQKLFPTGELKRTIKRCKFVL